MGDEHGQGGGFGAGDARRSRRVRRAALGATALAASGLVAAPAAAVGIGDLVARLDPHNAVSFAFVAGSLIFALTTALFHRNRAAPLVRARGGPARRARGAAGRRGSRGDGDRRREPDHRVLGRARRRAADRGRRERARPGGGRQAPPRLRRLARSGRRGCARQRAEPPARAGRGLSPHAAGAARSLRRGAGSRASAGRRSCACATSPETGWNT